MFYSYKPPFSSINRSLLLIHTHPASASYLLWNSGHIGPTRLGRLIICCWAHLELHLSWRTMDRSPCSVRESDGTRLCNSVSEGTDAFRSCQHLAWSRWIAAWSPSILLPSHDLLKGPQSNFKCTALVSDSRGQRQSDIWVGGQPGLFIGTLTLPGWIGSLFNTLF